MLGSCIWDRMPQIGPFNSLKVDTMVSPQDIQNWISQGLDNSKVTVEGDGQHFEAIIVSENFQGKSLIQRHQMVYKVLGVRMKSEIHALSMKTLTPGEL